MARRVKFGLEMSNGYKATSNIEEIRDNFDYGKIIGYFLDGRLERWLKDRGYENEAKSLSRLNMEDKDFKEEFCSIFQVDSTRIDIDLCKSKEVENTRKRDFVSQYTDDKEILEKIDCIATNQEELERLGASGIAEIYLCGQAFTISPIHENVKYIGINKVSLDVENKEVVNFDAKGIHFKNVIIDNSYMKACSDNEIAFSRCDRADIVLEILACLINGETEQGDFIWKSRSRINKKWPYKFKELDLDLSILERDIYCRIQDWINKNDEKIIFIIEYDYHGLSMYEGGLNNELLVLTDRTLYYYGEGKQYRCRYCDLMNVTVPLAGMVLIDLQNGKKLHINKRRTVCEVGDESLRLFLLIMAKKLGDCRYEFTSSEKSILEKIGLDNNGENCSSIYNFGTDKGRIECDDKKESENIWAKIAAELLGVIIHGELRNGQIIFAREGHKKETGKITYTALPLNEFTEVNIVPALKEHLSQYNNYVIGLVFEQGYRTSDQYLIFGDKAIYTQNSNLEWFSIRYEKINKVKVMNNSELVITMCDEKGWKFLPGSKLWKNKVGLNNFRLFLLIAAKVLGDCKYEFTGEELKKLRKVKLDSLDGICILECM